MGALVGLAFGVGVLLLLPRRRARVRTMRRMPWQRVGLAAAVGVPSGLVAALLTGSVSLGVCGAAFGVLVPASLARAARERRRRELLHAWPDVVDHVASAVRAGMPLPEALGALADRGPTVLRGAFARFAAAHRASGRFEPCLDQLKADLADPAGDRICESLRLAREVGGTDLGRLLRTLSAFLREDARIRAELETRQGWTVNAARLAVASPWLVLLLLATQPTALSSFDSGTGRLLLGLGATISAAAYWLMLRIGRLPGEPRILGRPGVPG